MGINQFAKISPVVNSEGYLLEKDSSENYSRTSTVRLKDNEIGICIEDKSALVMFKGNPVKLSGGIYDTYTAAEDYAKTNKNSAYDGQLLIIKNDPTQLFTIVGTQLYNLTENSTKTLVVRIPSHIEDFTIENSIMQNIYSKEYLINSIDIKFPGTNYRYIIKDEELNTVTKYPTIILEGSKEGIFNIDITDTFYHDIRFIVNDMFKGKLNLSMKVSEYDIENKNKPIISYGCDSNGNGEILIIITYTILN